MQQAKMNSQLLEILRCPQDHTVLTEADEKLLSQVNDAIREGRVANSSGAWRSDPIERGLVRAAGDILYPIVDEIPLLLRDEAIRLDQLENKPPEKQQQP
jgi:uncharacterized protein YbaR (Trm112 family)